MIIYSNKNVKFSFVKPYYLMLENELRLIKGIVKNGTLQWKINSVLITYKKIKNKDYARL